MSPTPLALTAHTLRLAHAGALATLAQAEYDAWDPTDLDAYAGGGICHRIADRFAQYLDEHGIEAQAVSSCHEQHVYVVAALANGVFVVDVSYSLYEIGAGYRWSKRPNVRLTANHVAVEAIDVDPSRFADYVDA